MSVEVPGIVCVRRVNSGFAVDETFLALRIAGATEVAVRVYSQPIRSDHDRLRFDHEVARLRVLEGQPHVLVPQETGVTADGHPYIVTEYCTAGSLHDHLVKVGRFTPTAVRTIGAKLAIALGSAHRREVYHRGVKPTNILLNRAGEPMLSDFALVSVTTADGQYVPLAPEAHRPYMAPEAFLPELMAAEADIYSLGATLYALLAGWAPRAGDPLAPAIDGTTVIDLPKVPFALMSIIRRAMALDPRERYDAFELACALG
jgi:serine/threonine protein kinase